MGQALKRNRRQRPHDEHEPAGSSAAAAEGKQRTARLLAALIAGALGAWAFRGAPSFGFSQDDWSALARAGGLAERLGIGWRWLSQQVFWDAVVRLLGSNAGAAHGVVLAAHALSTALLVLLLARWFGPAAALAGGALFATHFAQYTALYWLSASGDVFAVLLTLAAAHAFLDTRRRRFLAAPLFVAALLCKESVLAAPLVFATLAWRVRPGDSAGRSLERDPLAWMLAAISLGWAFALRPGSALAGLGGAAYQLDPRAIGPNLLTYAGWAANAWLPTVRDVGDRVTSRDLYWAIALLAIWLAAIAIPATRRRGAHGAFVAFVALLLPVLPLSAHTYHYYLVAALPALAWLLAATFDALPLGRRTGVRWLLSGAACAALAVNGGALAQRIETAPFLVEGLRADPVVDRARIAANVIEGLRAASLPARAEIRIWSPQAQAMGSGGGAPGDREGYYESNLRTALADGLAIRVALPGVERVAFVRQFEPADSPAVWAVSRYDGRVRVMPARELARALQQRAR